MQKGYGKEYFCKQSKKYYRENKEEILAKKKHDQENKKKIMSVDLIKIQKNKCSVKDCSNQASGYYNGKLYCNLHYNKKKNERKHKEIR